MDINIADQTYPVIELLGHEALSKPYSFECEIHTDFYFPAEQFLAEKGLLELKNAKGHIRNIAGIVTSVSEIGQSSDQKKRVRLIFESGLALLKQEHDAQIFLNKKIQEILRTVIEKQHFSREQIKFHFDQEYDARPYTLQVPGETDFEFIHRLIAKCGIFYWLDVDNDNECIHFSDNNFALSLNPQSPFTYIQANHLGPHDADLGEDLQSRFYNLQPCAKSVAQKFLVTDYNEETPSNVVASRSKGGGKQAHYFGLGAKNNKDAEQFVKLLEEHAEVDAWHLQGKSNINTLKPGDLFSLDASQLHSRYNTDYLVTEIRHEAKQAPGEQGEGESQSYKNTVKLIKRKTPYRDKIPEHPKLPMSFTAKIESNGTYAYLDDQGRYHLRQHFDRSDTEHTQAMPALRRMTPYAGPPKQGRKPSGIHMPLQEGAEVILSCLNGDPDRPIILGTVPNHDKMSPVTSHNKHQNRILTQSDNELLFDDKQHAERIVLRTYNAHNILEMNAKKGDHKITLASYQGAVNIKAKYDIHIESGNDTIEQVGKDRIHRAKEKHKTQTQEGDIHHQAKTHQLFTAKENTRIQSGKDIRIKSKKHTGFIVEQGATINVMGSEANITVEEGSFNLQSAKNITITGTGKGPIEITQNGAGIKIDPDGATHLFGNSINLSSASGVKFIGQVNYTGGSPATQTVVASKAKSVEDIRDLKLEGDPNIINLTWDRNWLPITETASAQFSILNFNGGESGTVKVYEYHGEKPMLVEIQSFTLKNDQCMGEITLPWTWSAKEEQEKQHNQTPKPKLYHFEVEIGDTKSDMFSNDLYLTKTQHITINTEKERTIPDQSRMSLYTELKDLELKPDKRGMYPQTNLERYSKKSQCRFSTIPIGTSELTARWMRHTATKQQTFQNIEFLDENNGKPWYKTNVITTEKSELEQESNLTCLSPPIICDLREDADPDKDPNARDYLTDDELNYFESNGNNLTIFIHGYNSHRGKFSKHIESFHVDDDKITPVFSEADATTYRDENLLKKQFPEIKDAKINLDKEFLNGAGAHKWIINMEDNLNRAAGFDHTDYTKFTRIVGILWEGDPEHDYDYMTAVQQSLLTGPRLAKLVNQIHNEKPDIKINIIAHSQGNGVLVKAMDVLGKDAANIINHAFFWEPAIPDNALSPSEKGRKKNDPWYLPNAHKSAKKITILYSNNDNIVGPIPKTQAPGVTQLEVNKETPIDELLYSELISSLDLYGMYEIAHWVGLPTSYLFAANTQEKIYQHFRKEHPTLKLNPSFKKQIEWEKLQGRFQALYHNLRDRIIETRDQVCNALKEASHPDVARALWMKEEGFIYAGPILSFLSVATVALSIREPVFAYLILKKYKGDIIHFTEIIEGAITLALVMFVEADFKHEVRHAMGWDGPEINYDDPNDFILSQNKQGKIRLENQTPWLWSHSAMREPNKDVMEHVYKGALLDPVKGMKFGDY